MNNNEESKSNLDWTELYGSRERAQTANIVTDNLQQTVLGAGSFN